MMAGLALGAASPTLARADDAGGLRLSSDESLRWGVEIDAIRPVLAEQLQLKGTYTAWRSNGMSGEAVVGANALFGRVNDDGKQSEGQLVVGYRQFLWRGLHAEAVVLPGWARQRSSIDGQRRDAFVLSGELVGGYRWDVTCRDVAMYLLTDLGVGLIGLNTNEWPETSASAYRTREPYFAGNIALGVRL